MLLAIRDKVTGWIAYGIIFLISIPFALWGVHSYLGGGEAAPAATVNGEEISVTDLDRAYAVYRQRLSRMFGGTIPASLGNEEVLRAQVLGQMIEEMTLQQYVESQRFRVGDSELARVIRATPEFQRDGQFDSELYEAQLRSIGMSPLAYEQSLRIGGAMRQFQSGLTATAFSIPQEEKKFSSLKNQTRKLRSLRYKVEPADVEVSDSEIEQHYLSQAERYKTQEQVKVDYIELSIETVEKGIEVSEEDVRARYEANLAAYTSPESRNASHILIRVGAESDSDAALQKITEIRERIVNGEDFAELAREYSEDPGSASDGGNLGDIERGFMVQSFESVLYSMQVDELSEPVNTSFGWHLIKLHSVSGGETRSFDSVRSEIEAEIRKELAEGQIFDLAENLANIAYEQPDSLAPAADQLGLELKTSDWFQRMSGEGIAAEAAVRQQAFSDPVLRQGLNSEGIQLGAERVVFIRLNELQPARQMELAEVRDAVESDLRRIRAREQAATVGRQGLEALQGGKTLEDLQDEWDATIDDHGFVSRTQADVAAEVRNQAFRMPRPDQGLVYEGVSVAGGEYVVIELSALVSNDAVTDEEAVKELTNAVGQAEYRASVDLLIDSADVVRTPLEEL